MISLPSWTQVVTLTRSLKWCTSVLDKLGKASLVVQGLHLREHFFEIEQARAHADAAAAESFYELHGIIAVDSMSMTSLQIQPHAPLTHQGLRQVVVHCIEDAYVDIVAAISSGPRLGLAEALDGAYGGPGTGLVCCCNVHVVEDSTLHQLLHQATLKS